MVHSPEAYEAAVRASSILFGKDAAEILKTIDQQTLLDVFEGVPTFEVSAEELKEGIPLLDLLAVKTGIFPSKAEARKMTTGGGVQINKEKVTDPAAVLTADQLIAGKYILAQRGKKNYFLITAV